MKLYQFLFFLMDPVKGLPKIVHNDGQDCRRMAYTTVFFFVQVNMQGFFQDVGAFVTPWLCFAPPPSPLDMLRLHVNLFKPL